MDRRAKKLEKKRKGREQAKKKAKAMAAQQTRALAGLIASAGSAEFGPCWVSERWDNLELPELVTVVVTRKLATGQYLPGITLVDRTCLGIKDGYVVHPMATDELEASVKSWGSPHGGMVPCEPLVAQSIVFHAIRYARSLGFEPHRDFPARLFGAEPPELVDTPWHAPETPIYHRGPYDDVTTIKQKLTYALGADAFDDALRAFDELEDGAALSDVDDFDDDDARENDDEVAEDDSRGEEGEAEAQQELVRSPLERAVSRDGLTVQIYIYRFADESDWFLEIEDHLGGSTVWDDLFDTDDAALQEALDAIEEDGIASFTVKPEQSPSIR